MGYGQETGASRVFGVSQHVDVAALLIKYNACVNATDKWAFTPLHEAAQKGRTLLCALLLAHGADPTLRNQEGQSPLDLVTVFHDSLCSLHRLVDGILTLFARTISHISSINRLTPLCLKACLLEHAA